MDENVFQALDRLFGQFQVEPDAAGGDIAGAPLSFHLLDAPSVRLNPQDRLPFI
ncbi:hypothetical protein D3C76_1820980 [compost metagenome]